VKEKPTYRRDAGMKKRKTKSILSALLFVACLASLTGASPAQACTWNTWGPYTTVPANSAPKTRMSCPSADPQATAYAVLQSGASISGSVGWTELRYGVDMSVLFGHRESAFCSSARNEIALLVGAVQPATGAMQNSVIFSDMTDNCQPVTNGDLNVASGWLIDGAACIMGTSC
jgi:hypothetical protein